MRRAIAAILVAVLSADGPPLLASGQQPRAPADANVWLNYLKTVPIGARVKVSTTDGKSFKGMYMGMDADRVNVQPRTRIPEPVRSIPISSLSSLEVQRQQGMSTGKVIEIAAAVSVAAIVGFLLLVRAIAPYT